MVSAIVCNSVSCRRLTAGCGFISHPPSSRAGINVNGFARLSINIRGQLSVIEMETLASVDRLESRIEGILGSAEGSEFYNDLIEQLLPDTLAQNQRLISDRVAELLMPVLNEQLSGMTLADLMAGGGSGGEVPPCIRPEVAVF